MSARRGRLRRLAEASVWPAVVVLALIGLVGSAARGWSVLDTGVLAGAAPPELSRLDEASLDALARAAGVESDHAFVAEIFEQDRRLLSKFYRHPIATLLHVLPGALFMILAPLQFSRRIRARSLAWHRWSGRILVAIAIPIGLSGLFFGVLMPFSGLAESSAIALAGAVFLGSSVLGFAAIRKREVARHREWMIRMCAIAFGVSVVRLAGTVLAIATMEGPETWFAASLWIGFGLSAAAGEIWIRGTRRSGARSGDAKATVALSPAG